MGPALEQLAQQDAGITLRKVNIVSWSTPVARQFGLNSIPNVRVYDRHGPDHDYFPGPVMRDILIFLGRGFALFAGGPAAISQYQNLSRSASLVAAQRRVRGVSEC